MDEKQSAPGGGTFTAASGDRDPTTAPAHDSVMRYINRSIDMNSLTGDIQRVVTEHIENSIPDDKKLMLELVTQVSELTGEVKQLRQQLDSKPYAVFTCPSGQIKDITEELAEIKQLLQQDPKPMELATTDIDPVMLEVTGRQSTEKTEPPEPPTPLTTPPLRPSEPPTASPPPTVEEAPQKSSAAVFAEQMAPTPPPVVKKSEKNALYRFLGMFFFMWRCSHSWWVPFSQRAEAADSPPSSPDTRRSRS